jgi:hypothetical protein
MKMGFKRKGEVMSPEEAKRIALAVACMVIEDYGYELIKNWKTDEDSLQTLQNALTELRDELEAHQGPLTEHEQEERLDVPAQDWRERAEIRDLYERQKGNNGILNDDTLRKLRVPSLLDDHFE